MPPRWTALLIALIVAGCGAAPSPLVSEAPAASSPRSAAVTPAVEPSPSASTADDSVHIALGGRGPIGLDIVGDRAWVILTDSGDLVEVDLPAQRVARTIAVGTGGSQVIATDDGAVYVGRFDTGGVGSYIVVFDVVKGTVDGISVGPVGGLALEDLSLWVLQKSGQVGLIDRTSNRVTSSVAVHVDLDAHMDAVAGAGSVWVSGDRTPVHRISGPISHVVADIETGGGIPLAYAGGLVWGARPDELWAIDPASNTVTRTIPLENVDEILALALDTEANEAWIAIRRPGRVGTVIAVGLASEAVVSETRVSLPAGVRLTADRAWVTNYDTDELVGLPRP